MAIITTIVILHDSFLQNSGGAPETQGQAVPSGGSDQARSV